VIVPNEHVAIMYDFIGESSEVLDQIDIRLHQEGTYITPDTLQLCFRLFHTIKGSAGFLRLDHFYDLARTAETFFDVLCANSTEQHSEYSLFIIELCSLTRKALHRIPAECRDNFFAESSRQLIDKINCFPEIERLDKDRAMNPEVLEAFIGEINELLAVAEQEFVLWEQVVDDDERLIILYRILHRLTENFSFYGYADLMTLSKAIESVLDRYIKGEVLQGEYPEEAFLQVIDAMRDTVDSLAQSGTDKINGLDALLDLLQTVMRMPLGEIFVKTGIVESQIIEQALQVQATARDPQKKNRRLGEVLVAMGEVTSDQLSLALTQQKKSCDPGTGHLDEAGKLSRK